MMKVAFISLTILFGLVLGLPQLPREDLEPNAIESNEPSQLLVASGSSSSTSQLDSSGTYIKSKTKSKSKICLTERVNGVLKENCKDEEKQVASHSKLCSRVNVGGIVKDKCEDTYLNTNGEPCETGFKQEGKHCVRTTELEEAL